MNQTIKKIKNNPRISVVFTDLFDTLIHRRVHPHYVYRIWAKYLIRDLGLNMEIESLYKIRMCSADTLSKNLGLRKVEIGYRDLMEEVYNRLCNSNFLRELDFEVFFSYSAEADYRGELLTQFVNEELIAGLKYLKNEGYKVYIVSDFHLPHEIIRRLLIEHGIFDVFDGIFMSCDLKKSKENGNLYPLVLKETNSLSEQTVMIGDNKTSDYSNATKNNLHAYHLRHYRHKIRNKTNLLGSVKKDFEKRCKSVEKSCRNSQHPFSEYILHFYFFTENLYLEARRRGIRDLFFLSREGLYLKQLFDRYQEFYGLTQSDYIRTHYFKASRHSAMNVSLKPIEEEKFGHLKKKYDNLSTEQFLDSFNFSIENVLDITRALNIDKDQIINDFLSSETFKTLRGNEVFKHGYEKYRKQQKEAFNSYLNSFKVDFERNGMFLVDVGWGGTMQECIYEYMNGKAKVTGFYLGLKEIYRIERNTKRFGLNFSIYPKKEYADSILLANGQLYEQMLAAPHGSTTGYRINKDSPTLEFHEPNEKRVFHEFISPIQGFMDSQFDVLCNNLATATYTNQMFKDYITGLALRLGLLANRKKIKFIQLISQGFYQNVGNNKVGLAYDPNQLKISKFQFLKEFLWSPEKTFQYLVKIKPFLYDKGLSWLGWTVSLSYYYIKANRWFKSRFFSKQLL